MAIEIDGMMYPDDMQPEFEIVDARVLTDDTMRVRFSTGEQGTFCITPLINAPAFKQLADPDCFKNFNLDLGTLNWCDGTIDIAPEKVYELCGLG